MNLKAIFNSILKTLRDEDKYLLRFAEKNECGISNLDEKHVQYIVYKNLLKLPGIRVFMEDPYGKGNLKCDLTIWSSDYRRSIWVEIKTVGWCWDSDYKRWIQLDLKKIKRLKKPQKYLLVTSVEDEKPEVPDWIDYFKRGIPGIKFYSELFGFIRTRFIDEKKPRHGYYTLCLLKVL